MSALWQTATIFRSILMKKRYPALLSLAVLHVECQQLCHSARYVEVKQLQHGSAIQTHTPQQILPKKLRSGQPTPGTHPHLVKPGQVTFGITLQEYSARRHKLVECMTANNTKHHVIILPATPRRYMIDKIPYLYRQDTDMLYMSGCLEPDCVLVVHTLPSNEGASRHKSVMFTPCPDPSQELWDGPRTGPSVASQVWGVDIGLPITEISRYLGCLELDLNSPDIWYNFHSPSNNTVHNQIRDWLLVQRSGKIESPKHHLHSLRVIKSPAEIDLMRQTCKISGDAISSTMQATSAPTTEHKLFATVDYHCRMLGADHLAYPPVVAGGTRSNIIHYINNNQVINDGELVLMDAGGEFRGYSGDITRTWPINGSFTSAQRDLYEAVREVQITVIDACTQHPTLDALFSIMCNKLGRVLRELCILPRSFTDGQLTRAAFGFCPHHVSHYLGMDVHDTHLVPRNKKIQPSSIITVEPGIYINETNTSVPSRYRGIGIRLEDDILITESGVEVLTSSCPSHPDEVLALVGKDIN